MHIFDTRETTNKLPIQYTVSDTVTLLDPSTDEVIHSSLDRQSGSFSASQSSSSFSSSDALLLVPPEAAERFVTNHHHKNSSHVSRVVAVETASAALAKGIMDKKVASVELHSVRFKTLPRIPLGAKHRSVNCILPTAIHSYSHSVEVRHITEEGAWVWDTLDRRVNFFELQNAIRSGYDFEFLGETTSVLNGNWQFLIDGPQLKLAPDSGGVVAMSSRAEAEISFTASGFIISTGTDTGSDSGSSNNSTAITAAETTLVVHGGGCCVTLRGENLPASATRCRYFNSMGITSPIHTAPIFVTALWEKIYLNSKLADVKAALVKVMDRGGGPGTPLKASATAPSSPVPPQASLKDDQTSSVSQIAEMVSAAVSFNIFLPFQTANSNSSPSKSTPQKASSQSERRQGNESGVDSFTFEGRNPHYRNQSLTPLSPSSSSSSVLFYDRLYSKLAEITNKHFQQQTNTTEIANINRSDSSHAKSPALLSDRLALYLEQVPLPNWDQPLSSALTDFVLLSLPKDETGQISKELFRKWFISHDSDSGVDGSSGPGRQVNGKPNSKAFSSTAPSAASSGSTDTYSRNERSFFAELLLEDFIGNKMHRFGEIERDRNGLKADGDEEGEGDKDAGRERLFPSVDQKRRKEKDKANNQLLNSVGTSWNKRRFLTTDKKGHIALHSLSIECLGLAALLGPVGKIRLVESGQVQQGQKGQKLAAPASGQKAGRRGSTLTKIDYAASSAVLAGAALEVRYRKADLYYRKEQQGADAASVAHYKTHRKSSVVLPPSTWSEEEKDGGLRQPQPGPPNSSFLDRMRAGISNAATDVFQRKFITFLSMGKNIDSNVYLIYV